jgi:hypothetical protein
MLRSEQSLELHVGISGQTIGGMDVGRIDRCRVAHDADAASGNQLAVPLKENVYAEPCGASFSLYGR